MLDRLKALFAADADSGPARPDERLAVALLLLDLARADFDIADVERLRIGEALARRYALTAADTRALIDAAERRARETVPLHAYLDRLNADLDAPAKQELMRLLWQLAWADGRVDKYEEHLLRKLAALLYLSEQDYVRAKLAAQADAAAGAQPAADDRSL